GVCRMRAWFHPDTRLDAAVAHLVGPYRNRIVEMKACDAHMAGRRDRAALPSVREQGPATGGCDYRRIGLGEQKPASERRGNRRNQQSVVTAGGGGGEGGAPLARAAR